jgi:hypothetical protein
MNRYSRHTASPLRRRGLSRRWLAVPATLALAVSGLSFAPAAFASTVSSAVFTGGAGTVSQGGTLYAKSGGAVTLTVNTSADTTCVDVAGAFTGHQTSATAKSSWTFTTTAGAGDGAQAVTSTASAKFNANGCTGASGSLQASYVLDNTGPVVTAALSPAANANGWNNSDVTVKWTATDTGSGVSAAQPFQTDGPITANGVVTKTAPAQSDRLGNTGAAGSVTVRIDKAAPSISHTVTQNADGTYTVTFNCSDSQSGGAQSSGIATCVADGTSPASSSKTVPGNTTVSGTAIDTAGNKATDSVTTPQSDTTPPSISGSATTQPDGTNGWYKSNVAIHWTCTDSGSGVASCPSDGVISSEGKSLTLSGTATDKAGNTANGTSTPVNIDKTAPVTGISGNSNSWVNGNVTLTLNPTDNLSGIAATKYSVDGGATQSGTSVSLSTDGTHTVSFFSVDNAGNTEAANSVQVKIDKTAPTISHSFGSPAGYNDGDWTNSNVSVTFSCGDTGSGVASCGPNATVSTEGAGQSVVGTAKDNAGNSASNTALVNIDKTAPTIHGSVNQTPNGAGWFNSNVDVSFLCNDALSGVASCPGSQTLSSDGGNQSVNGTAKDVAGNSASDTVSGIKIDETPPALNGSFTPGWHTGDVTVNWTCTDALSGPTAQPADSTVTGEGDALSAAASCEDVAGNVTNATAGPIKIDRTAPVTQASVDSQPNANGWYNGSVNVTLNATDKLSGVAKTLYSVDGGPDQVYNGSVSVGGDGTHTVSFYSVDNAGNTETAGAPITVSVDTKAPTTTVVNPISPDSGWFVNSGIPVAFQASDATSGVAATYYTIDGGAKQTYGQPFTADLSTGKHTITYWSVDLAGNEEAHANTNTIPVNVDTVPPTITGSVSPQPNANGWNNTDVKVTFQCSDADSGIDGIAGCGPNQTVSAEDADQSVQGDAQDVAGNKSSTTVDHINIDKTAPSVQGALPDPSGTDANGKLWYNGNVTVTWTAKDGLSGIDPSTAPGTSTISGEGRGLSASAKASDLAGNEGSGSVTGVNIDRGAPDIQAAMPAGANAAGWYNGKVVVGFSCSDPALNDGSAGSGVANCPQPAEVTADGGNQSVTSEAATDYAGNRNPGKTVSGIKIDGTAPQTSANNQCTATNNYCKGSTATVVLTATDATSGVKEIHYSLNGGAEQVAAGAQTPVNVPLSGSGTATVKYYSVDNAGNTEAANTETIKYDNIAPTVTHTVNPGPNSAGWNNSDVTVHFDAKDDDSGSGIAAGSITPDKTISTETSGTVVNGQASDTAGNTGTDSVTVKLDKTAPTISGAITSGTKGNNGWYTTPVVVHFTCGDALSGVASCDKDVTLSANGANQSAQGQAMDVAGNGNAASVSGINIDNENPTITGVNVAGGQYTVGAVPNATCTATDSFSGFQSCSVTVTGGNGSVGTFNWTATATDKAGNTISQSGTYKVVYRFDGFLQPINDTAHQTGLTTSVFKGGSTVPVKFQLKNAAGNVVQSASAPIWLTPVKGVAMSMPVDETAVTVSADSGSTYRYDTGQYIYNWKAPTGGNYYQIGVKLDDGQIYYVNIGLR